MALYSYSEGPDGNNNVGVRDVQITIDEKVRHATFGAVQNTDNPAKNAMYMPLSRMPFKIFTKEYIMRMSK